SASGSTSRRLAMPARSSGGPAASVPASANISPAPRTKSRWNGKRLPTIGTNSTPPPTPASTATMPIAKLTANSAIGQTHHGTAQGERGIACLPGREREFRQGVERAVEYAAAVGCARLNCIAGLAAADPQHFHTLVANVRHAARRLGEVGVQLMIEPINTRS